MRALARLHDGDKDETRFFEIFVREVHSGQWDTAGDHWERTVAEFLDTKEMEKLSASQATQRAEKLAMGTLWYTAKRWGRCPWCT
ncbi:DUF6313 family protein [Streptosporangium sp. NPDC051022]|uniref:DUF6313 family protein n=1 Tax=Streptosporangium sp. NPDC051022 TaxID=3155752 RepID=UPI0034469664